MSDEQPQPQPESSNSPGEIIQQAKTSTPTTKPAKNPKRVAAGKMVAERTRLAREAQKKAAVEAAIIIANNNRAKAETAVPEPFPTIEEENPKTSEATNSLLTTTQWLAVGSLVVGLIGLYYKCEELKTKVFSKMPARVVPQPTPVQAASTPQPKGLRHMD